MTSQNSDTFVTISCMLLKRNLHNNLELYRDSEIW